MAFCAMDSIVSLLVLILQAIACLFGISLVGRILFGFGLDSEGGLIAANRRGKALVRLTHWISVKVKNLFSNLGLGAEKQIK